jgi:hypothetical protein
VSATSNTEGFALAVLLTDVNGNLLAQAENLSGAEVTLTDVQLGAGGAYYVTVLRATSNSGNGDFTLLATSPDARASEVNLPNGMVLSLNWQSTDDLNLELRDPVGGSVFASQPTSTSGGTFGANANGNCTNTSRTPVESVAWGRGAVPTGSYEIIVYFTQACNQPAQAVNFTLTLTVNGRVQDTNVTGSLTEGSQYVAGFVINSLDDVEIRAGGANPLLLNLTPYADQIANPSAINIPGSVTGNISNADSVDVYRFEGRAGQVVSATMNAVQGGSLDTQLFVLDARGNVLQSNDDASATTRDAAISLLPLPADGQYRLVATRFGKEIGGTEGNYLLNLTFGGNVAVAAPTLAVAPPVSGTPAAVATPIPAGSFAGLTAGSIQISLVWNTSADMRLLVRDPQNRSLFSDVRSIPGGGQLERIDNLNCQNSTNAPLTYAYWPLDQLLPGTYEVQVWLNNSCNVTTLPSYTLTASVRGKEVIRQTGAPDPNKNIFVTTFTIDSTGGATAGTGGTFTRQVGSDLGDLSANLASASELVYGRPAGGIFDVTVPFSLYTFQARAGDQVRIGLRTISGSLDPFLYLLDSTGFQLAQNDDVVAGRDANSRIDIVIPADGAYTIVASRFGAKFGGTSGTYEISITPLSQ